MNDFESNAWGNDLSAATLDGAGASHVAAPWADSPIFQPLPILYEDDGYEDMGESNIHVTTDEILRVCLSAHFAGTGHQVYANMNLYYRWDDAPPESRRWPYVSPDLMVVTPYEPLPYNVVSYRIGCDGPPPFITGEILSERSAQQRDLADKLVVYSKLQVQEYLLVDITGRFLKQKLLLKRLDPHTRDWSDHRDADGGITSQWGFRIIIDADERVRVINAATGERYPRPDEAILERQMRLHAEAAKEAEAEARKAEEQARHEAEARAQALEAELARLREQLKQDQHE